MVSRLEREQIRLREKILKTALHIAECEVWSNVSISKSASEIEYSTTTVYELFEIKNHLSLELLRNGFKLLANQLEEAVSKYPDPQKKAIALGKAYCAFAWENGA